MRFTVRVKLYLVAGLLLGITAFSSIASYYFSTVSQKNTEQMQSIYMPALLNINDIEYDIAALHQAITNYLNLPIPERIKSVEEAQTKLNDNMAKLVALYDSFGLTYKSIIADELPKFNEDVMGLVSAAGKIISINEQVNIVHDEFKAEVSNAIVSLVKISEYETKKTSDIDTKLLQISTDFMKYLFDATSIIAEAHFNIDPQPFEDMASDTTALDSLQYIMNETPQAYESYRNEINTNYYAAENALIQLAGDIALLEQALANYDEKVATTNVSIAKFVDYIVNGTTKNMTDNVAINEFTTNFMMMVGVIVILIAFISMYVLRVGILRPLANFVDLTRELTSGDGDLTRTLVINSNDEFKDLAHNVNMFTENVREIISEVKVSSDEVASGNNELAATMEELVQTFESQMQQISVVLENIDEISNISKVSADELDATTTVLSSTTDATHAGSNQLGFVKTSILEINKQTDQLQVTINSLNASSNQIGDILSVINDIADQTNLLALNAAIEAARAGEAGRGFAVVADEVRKLAERTQKATGEIETIITALQNESATASKEMSVAGETVIKGVNDIEETANGFETVVHSVEEINTTIGNVSDSVHKQSIAIGSVVDTTQIFASGLEQSTTAVAEVNTTIAHLQQRVEQLKILVSRFKI